MISLPVHGRRLRGRDYFRLRFGASLISAPSRSEEKRNGPDTGTRLPPHRTRRTFKPFALVFQPIAMAHVRSIFHFALFVIFLVLVILSASETALCRAWKWLGIRSLFKISQDSIFLAGLHASRIGK